jgi:hypothetical protein
MLNSTVSQNEFAGAAGHLGAGIGNAGVATIVGSTVSGNLPGYLHPPTDLWNESGGSVTLMNSILAGCGGSGSFVSLGYNLDSNGSCHLTGTGDRPNSNAGLGPLQNNGGPTQTLALLPGSDAIDAGDPEGCKDFDGNVLTTDQRGFIRAVDGGSGSARCDMGAYEFNATPPPVIADLVTVDSVVTESVPPPPNPQPEAPAGTFIIVARFRNTSASDICNPFFDVVELSGKNRLLGVFALDPDGTGNDVHVQGLDGSLLRHLPILLRPRQTIRLQFKIGLQDRRRFNFFVNPRGFSQLPGCACR